MNSKFSYDRNTEMSDLVGSTFKNGFLLDINKNKNILISGIKQPLILPQVILLTDFTIMLR